MPSIFTHAIAALAMGPAVQARWRPWRLWVIGAVCAALPDLDVVAFRFGIPYDHMLGHRGLTHSIAFAAVLAVLVVAVCFRRSGHRLALWAYVTAATASHGVLDALTDGGRGVAFLAPFSGRRFFFPWRPIEVAPIGVGRFFSERGLAVLASEIVWVWGPALVLAGVLLLWQRGRSARADGLSAADL